jgi:flavin reductase (DIM6/NTAB) family NADH-FMN oxidoreductase RutF
LTPPEASADALKAFHSIVSHLDYPMVVVTAAAAGERSGCLVGFHTQCSIDPPRWLIGISKKNHTYRIGLEAGVLTAHFLGEQDVGLARLFGEETGDEVDKFTRCRWHEGPFGAVVLDDCANWVAFRVLDHHDGGDHHLFRGEPVAAEREREQRQLSFQMVKDFHPGHEA